MTLFLIFFFTSLAFWVFGSKIFSEKKGCTFFWGTMKGKKRSLLHSFKTSQKMSSSRATNKLASERRRWWALAKRAQAEEALRRASRGGGAAALRGAPTPPNPNPKKREIHFPNLQLRLVAPSEEARMRGLEVATFITTPNVTKTEIKTFLTDVHGIEVLKVDTANYEGKKKRNLERGTLFRKPDYKKVYVTLGERWFPPERFCVPSK
jgi:ribosomal protein L23